MVLRLFVSKGTSIYTTEEMSPLKVGPLRGPPLFPTAAVAQICGAAKMALQDC